MRRFVAVLLALSLQACASMPAGERAFLVAAGADAASTYAALDRGMLEANPVMDSGDALTSAALVAIVSVLIHYALKRSLRNAAKPQQDSRWNVYAGVRFAPVAWNLYQLAED